MIKKPLFVFVAWLRAGGTRSCYPSPFTRFKTITICTIGLKEEKTALFKGNLREHLRDLREGRRRTETLRATFALLFELGRMKNHSCRRHIPHEIGKDNEIAVRNMIMGREKKYGVTC